MSSAKVAAAAVLVATSLSACGVAAKPVAGSPAAAATSKKQLFDPRTKHATCLRKQHVRFHYRRIDARDAPPGGYQTIQVMTRPSGPTVEFLATPGDAQAAQINGAAQGAEVIGSALLYPNMASDALLNKVEKCMTVGVTG
jgi:hypothetical protein